MHCGCFCRVECLRVSGGFHITCFYSLMVQINSSLIHGVIVGSCPEMDLAQWSGQPLRPHVTIIGAQA